MGGVAGMRTGSFSFASFANIVGRYQALPSTMLRSAAAKFDGRNWLINTTANFRSADSSGSICLWFKTSSSTEQTLFASHDVLGVTNFVWLFINSGAVGIYTNDAGTDYGVSTNAATFADGAWHFLEARSSGTSYTIRIDGNEETLADSDGDFGAGTNNGHWFADISGRDNISIGASIFSSTTYFLIGDVDTVRVFSAPLTDDQSDWLYDNLADHDDLVSSPDANNPGTTNLVFAPELDEESGVRLDKSSSNLHMTPAGNAAALTFAIAQNEWANSSTTPITAPPCSVTASFKTGTGGSFQGIAAVGAANTDKRVLGLNTSDKLIAYSRNSAGVGIAVSSSPCTDDAWHFGCAVFDVSSPYQEIYLDGAAGAEETTERAPDASYTDLAIGSFNPIATSLNFDGEVDNLGFWTIALTAAQKEWLRTGGVTGGAATYQDIVLSSHADNPGVGNLGAFYQLNEATGAATLVNVHNPGTHDMTTASDGAGPTTVTGTVTDLPISTDGTVTGTPEVEDRALEFDGADQSADANTAAISGVGNSIAVWVKSGTTTEQTALWIGDKDADDVFVRLGIDGSGDAFLGRNASGGGEDVTIGANIDDGLWHLLVAVLTAADDVDLYVDDGAAVNDTTSVALTGFDRTSVGRHGGATPSTWFDGSLDEPMIFDVLLDSDDIGDLYAIGAAILGQELIDETEALTSGANAGAKPIHAWPLSGNHASGAGADIGTTGGITLTLNNVPTDVQGIPAGQSLHGRVRQWSNRQASNNNLTQTTFFARPELVSVSYGTGYALRYDGIAQYLQLSTFAGGAISQPNVMFAVVRITELQSAIQTFISGVGAGAVNSFRLSAGDAARMFAGSTITGSAATTDLELWVGVFNGASSALYRGGGTADASGDVGAQAMQGIILGALADLSTFQPVEIIDLVVNDGLLSNAEINAFGQELSISNGLTWAMI